jgi:hypothetical protein
MADAARVRSGNGRNVRDWHPMVALGICSEDRPMEHILPAAATISAWAET